ncbi:DUF1673 domain-containing protein [Methanosarcina mazei]|uniref:DUF1673 domain-containing protein n=1 Tax=Methanosarcina mazei TaxID=2209 RepID=A0A0F8CPR0_METMZ|nr:DUF1673 domain-containing protein [Methanosarcina mazei]KKG06919.1 hypothetical protein DU47_10960 [Methanosarcina mazei]KKH85792.1 hypothetical protein DU80_18410 [Methanosarcina mazei]
MPVKIFVFDQIKKLMGWCPNAKKLEAVNQNSFSNFEAYDQSGKEKSNVSKASDKHSRLDIQLFLFPFFFTPIYINLFQKDINTEAFLLGLSLSLPIYLLGWKKQMHQYNAVKEKPVISPSFRKTLACIVLFLFLGITLLLVFLPYISPYFYLLNDQTLNSFVLGTLILMWGFYFQLIYWERKNHMKIYIKRENAQQKLYVLEEKGGEL